MAWVSGFVTAWLVATPVLLPVLGRLISAGHPTAPAAGELPPRRLHSVPSR